MGEEMEREEEFLVWKKNTPLLYGFVLSHSLEWPSLTVQFLPPSFSSSSSDDVSLSVHRLLLSTHTSDGFPNFLLLADALLPSSFDYPSLVSVPKVLIKCTQGRVFDEMPLCLTCNSHVCMPISLKNLRKMDVSKFDIIQKICVDGEVNRARYMHHKPSVIAAKTSGCEVYVFDCDKHHMNEVGLACQPDLRLMGHAKEGFGLSWSPFKEGYLLSGSNDCKICLWDVSTMPQNKSLQATHVYEAHESVVGDVSWHLKDENLFGSVGDDCRLIIWDLRTNKPQHSVQAHEKEVNYLSFNPYNDWIVATASSDTTVGLFDMRKLVSPLHTLGGHEEEVFQVEWDPNHETVLASSAGDRRLMVWDLNRIGDEQLEGEAEDGPPELLFSHAGHKAKISDFSWNKNQSWVISSVAEDNSIQVWQMDKNIYHEDDDLQAE